MSIGSESDVGARARDALRRHQWREAFDLLSGADAGGSLTPVELTLLADASWWTGQLPLAIDARERAFAAAMRDGDTMTAVQAAIGLVRENILRNSLSVASGWLNRADRLVADQPESSAHGWIAGSRSFLATLTGKSDVALGEAERAYQIGMRQKDRDLEIFGLSEKGAALLAKGEIDEGLAAVDEAAAAAISGAIEPATAGGVCCTTIETCASLGDWRRAAEWTEAQDRWCKREGLTGYPGMCRLFRSNVKRLRGAWLEAEAEARRASEELRGFVPAAVGQAYYQIGQIRLLRGDLDGAEEALLRGHSLGRDPEPTMSLLRLARGEVEAANADMKRALADPATSPAWGLPSDSDLYRLALLPAQVEIALAAHEVTTARSAADELAAISDRFDMLAGRAAATAARGSVLLADGDAVGATHELRRAVQLWSELDAPYEGARARVALADALERQTAIDAAALELQTAIEAFEELGAAPDARRAAERLSHLSASGAGSLRREERANVRATRAFMFTDIVDSTRLASTLGDDAWNRVLRWHDDTLRKVLAEHGGEEVKRTGDGFFLAFADIGDAIEAAISVQRRLAEHREADGGFAPSVRIGIHWADATRSSLDYIGSGVNQAARIGAAAAADEILVSAATLAATGRTFAELERRSAELKGISEPVEVVSIGWR
ncbi:MAG TPA: adenylate/guanylate cyclase domain-containing protein [Candidatus Limnocylindria bacterium]|nr:adenylate/guanylate cyclase domain-containing protein [Candidatus Limnocylindria bacterium]